MSLQVGDYVERGPGQLCRVIRAERKYHQDGYVILPLNNGTGDGYGYGEWVPASYALSRATTLDKWEYVVKGNRYTKKRTV